MTRIILVKPWDDAAAGGGCCSGGADGVALQHESHTVSPRAANTFAQTYRLLRQEMPTTDIQVVASSNTLFLLPVTFRAARRDHGLIESLGLAARSTTAGAVLVDGQVVARVDQHSPDDVLSRVRSALHLPR